MRFTCGVWEKTLVDARAGTAPFTEDFAEFNSGNPVLAFAADKGFGIFSESVSLPALLLQHQESLVRNSCGRCTPCRVGSRFLLDALTSACAGQGSGVDWEAMLGLALHMRDSSFCGIGRTGVVPLIEALSHFPETLRTTQPVPPVPGVYSLATSPCIEACPAHVEVPRYVDAVRDGREDKAVDVMLEHYPLVGTCGRICVRLCEHACRRGHVDAAVGIRNLKRAAADASPPRVRANAASAPQNGKADVAVIGAGPAGLACAYHLLRAGRSVDLFDAAPAPGGMARYGIPAYRLPKDVLDQEAAVVAGLGGRFFFNQRLGSDFSLSSLEQDGYKAVFIGIGASLGQFLHLPEDKNPPAGYENGIDFLRRVHDGVQAGDPPALHGDVVVVGGGNVAMDCCRSAARLTDGKVHVLYRRTQEDLPADHEEIEAALQEGVEFHFLSLPAGLTADDTGVTGIWTQKMRQGEPDASGRRSVSPIEGSDWLLPCSHVIAAIGQSVRAADIAESEGIHCGRNGAVRVDEHFATTRPHVFAGGDCASGPDTLIGALAQGEEAARSIIRFLDGKAPGFSPRRRMSDLIKAGRLLAPPQESAGRNPAGEEHPPRVPRLATPTLPPAQRHRSFAEVDQTLQPEAALAEADRCLRCYRLFTVVTASPIPDADA